MRKLKLESVESAWGLTNIYCYEYRIEKHNHKHDRNHLKPMVTSWWCSILSRTVHMIRITYSCNACGMIELPLCTGSLQSLMKATQLNWVHLLFSCLEMSIWFFHFYVLTFWLQLWSEKWVYLHHFRGKIPRMAAEPSKDQTSCHIDNMSLVLLHYLRGQNEIHYNHMTMIRVKSFSLYGFQQNQIIIPEKLVQSYLFTVNIDISNSSIWQ